jgi:hypothetical protein
MIYGQNTNWVRRKEACIAIFAIGTSESEAQVLLSKRDLEYG